MKKAFVGLSFLLLFFACSNYKDLPTPITEFTWKSKRIAPTPQTNTGDIAAGKNYMIYGDFIGSGMPFDFVKEKLTTKDTVLQRTGYNENVPYIMNVFEVKNGAKVMAGNCFTCHASRLNDEMILGLGNSFSDFRGNDVVRGKMLNFFVRRKYKKDSPERSAFINYGRYVNAVSPYIVTNNYGVNPAFRLEEACANHRDPVDLTYQKKPAFQPIDYTLAADVPPFWNIKKKNALYYNGMGRGSFTKLLMQASVLGIEDSTEARKVHDNMDDVLAWILSLEPPKYPKLTDPVKVEKGQAIFETHCSKCHGFYGEDEIYPNKLVSVDIVKTDPLYARYFTEKRHLADWYNKSWFATSYPKSELIVEDGYIAPPLDGIWASAPYLHNGSVPTLEDLLNSKQRPKYWKRSENSSDIDYGKVGWMYQKVDDAKKDFTYDTTLPGYGNQGHYFGDKLNNEERSDLIEYLKTL